MQKNTVNKSFFSINIIFMAIAISAVIICYLITGNGDVVVLGLILVLLLLSCNFLMVIFLRKKILLFSDEICRTIDNMIDRKTEPVMTDVEEETLFFKIHHRLQRLYEIMSEERCRIVGERAELQELISDISHQVKTPIANLKMIDSTLLEQSIPEEKQRDFLSAMDGQIDKLDFLMQAMIKTSRLETGVISLERKRQPVYDSLAAALGGILLNAEKKGIQVTVSCPEELEAVYDRKWTSEALFNLLDNAVKYTGTGGRISVSVESWEMYLKIDIADNGKGIAEERQGAIFKRFYREEEVHDAEGIGIGLYLARQIITMQGGYIKVTSEPEKGSTFSVFLPNRQ